MTCPDCGAELHVTPRLLSCKACGFTETDPSVDLPPCRPGSPPAEIVTPSPHLETNPGTD
jgi:hypothetical protein